MITGICSREERKNVLTRKRKRFKSCRQKGEKGSPGSIRHAEEGQPLGTRYAEDPDNNYTPFSLVSWHGAVRD